MTVAATQATLPTRATFRKKVFVWLGLASLLFTGVTALLFASITQLVGSIGWVAHSYQVLEALDVTEDVFTDAQSEERGYVATCKPMLLSPFRADVPRLYSQLAALRSLTADNPAQRRRADELSTAVGNELARMSTVVAENMRGDQKGAESMLIDTADTRVTRAVFAITDDMQDAERVVLAARQHEVERLEVLTFVAAIAGVAGCFGILAFVFWLIRRETRRREESELSLVESNAKLTDSLGELRHYAGSARAIAVLGEFLQTCRNTAEALSIAARHIEQLLPDASGAIAIFSNSRDMLDVVQRIGDGAAVGEAFTPDACWALRRSRPHRSHRGGGEPCCPHLGDCDGDTLCLPLSARSETLGLMSITLPRPEGLAGIDRQAIQTIAEQLSLALTNIRLHDTLRNQSFRDPLTGLFNRRYMDEALAREIARAQRHGHDVAIAMLDIDHFKRFNDTYGHEGGDVLLAAFAQLVADSARAEDIVCRYGGEEFVVILPGASIEIAAERMDALRLQLKRLRVDLRGQPLGPVSMSAGVAVFPAHGATGASVLHIADAALYQAKAEGRDRVIAAPTPAALQVLGRMGKAG